MSAKTCLVPQCNLRRIQSSTCVWHIRGSWIIYSLVSWSQDLWNEDVQKVPLIGRNMYLLWSSEHVVHSIEHLHDSICPIFVSWPIRVCFRKSSTHVSHRFLLLCFYSFLYLDFHCLFPQCSPKMLRMRPDTHKSLFILWKRQLSNATQTVWY